MWTLRRVTLVKTDLSDKRITSIIMVDSCHPDDEAIHSSESSVLNTSTWSNIPEDSILHSYRHENIKSYIQWTQLAIAWCEPLGLEPPS
jgi:hypothetical protein